MCYFVVFQPSKRKNAHIQPQICSILPIYQNDSESLPKVCYIDWKNSEILSRVESLAACLLMLNQQMQFWIQSCDNVAFQPGNQVSFAEVRPEIVMEHGDLEEEGHSHDCHGHSHDHLEEHLDMEGHGHSHSIFEPCCLASWIQLILLVVGVLLVLLVLFVRMTTR